MKLLFFGSDRFSEHVLGQFLHNCRDFNYEQLSKFKVDVVLTNVLHSKKNKLNHFFNYLDMHRISYFTYPLLKEAIRSFNASKSVIGVEHSKLILNHEFDYDMGIVASFGRIIPTDIIEAFRYGMINVHPSILPQYRGASPIIYSLLNNDSITGVSILDVSKQKVDLGSIYLQEAIKIKRDETFVELRERLGCLGGDMLFSVLNYYDQYNSAKYNQTTEKVVDRIEISPTQMALPKEAVNQFLSSGPLINARKFKIEQTFIDWENDTGLTIYNKYRAFNGNLFLKTYFKNKIVHFGGMNMIDNIDHIPKSLIHKPGYFSTNHQKDRLYIYCKDNSVITASLIQIHERKALDCRGFLTGYIRDFSECLFTTSDTTTQNSSSKLFHNKSLYG